MFAIAVICSSPREDCPCVGCRHAALKNRLTSAMHILAWFQTVVDDLDAKTDLDPYHTGFRDALKQVIGDLEKAIPFRQEDISAL